MRSAGKPFLAFMTLSAKICMSNFSLDVVLCGFRSNSAHRLEVPSVFLLQSPYYFLNTV